MTRLWERESGEEGKKEIHLPLPSSPSRKPKPPLRDIASISPVAES